MAEDLTAETKACQGQVCGLHKLRGQLGQRYTSLNTKDCGDVLQNYVNFSKNMTSWLVKRLRPERGDIVIVAVSNGVKSRTPVKVKTKTKDLIAC